MAIDKPVPARHIGDGLYADFDGLQIKLWTDRGGVIHEVFLDDGTIRGFDEFRAELRAKGWG